MHGSFLCSFIPLFTRLANIYWAPVMCGTLYTLLGDSVKRKHVNPSFLQLREEVDKQIKTQII